MDAAEFAEWMAYYTLSPFGAGREDARFGVVASAVTAPWMPKGTPPRSPLDWFAAFHPGLKKAGPSPRELRDKFKALTLAMGGAVAGGG